MASAGSAMAAASSGWSPHELTLIDALLTHVEPKYQKKCGAILKGEAFSFAQGWQDWYLFHNLFRDRLQWGNGTYVDIGSNSPLEASNTLFFDKCLGWRGVCFEPQRGYANFTRQTRGCTLIPHCALGSAALVKTVGGGPLAKVEVLKGVSGGGKDGETQKCVVAPEVLMQQGIGPGSGRSVDLVSIDVEGNEPSVLKCWPFATWMPVRAVLIETQEHEMKDVVRFFHRHGFASQQSFSVRYNPRSVATLTDTLFVKMPEQHRLPPTGDDWRCTSNMKEHNHFWCASWLEWDPKPKVPGGWDRCHHARAPPATQSL